MTSAPSLQQPGRRRREGLGDLRVVLEGLECRKLHQTPQPNSAARARTLSSGVVRCGALS
ncbi:hypothetical protein [Streptomyces pristinaespiralis]|uniref:hypothetical protein n=1 Tax=Streptomyces pristinaespiralis TaxID=38300 RepID=UPI00384E36FF